MPRLYRAVAIQEAWVRLEGLDVRLAFLLWTVLALAVRFAAYRIRTNLDLDGVYYVAYARNIQHGDLFHPSPYWTPYAPLYPALVALTGALTTSLLSSGYAVSLCSGALLVGTIFLLARHLFGMGVAHLAALLALLNNHLIFYSDSVLSESTYYLLIVALLYVVVRQLIPCHGDQTSISPGSPWLIALIPALSVAVAATRYIGMVFVIALAGTSLVVARGRDQRVVSMTLSLSAVAALVTALLVSSAIQTRLTQVIGRQAASYPTVELSRALHSFYAPNELRTLHETSMTESPIAYARDNAKPLGRMALTVLRAHLSTGVDMADFPSNPIPVMPFYLTVLFGVGLWRALQQDWRATFLLVAPVVLLILPNLVFVNFGRYYLALLPSFLILAAYGLLSMFQLRLERLGRRLVSIPLLAVLCFMALSDAWYAVRPEHPLFAYPGASATTYSCPGDRTRGAPFGKPMTDRAGRPVYGDPRLMKLMDGGCSSSTAPR